MRRTPVLLPVVAAGRSGPTAVAAEGTPPAGGFEIAPGVTAEALAFAPGQEAPSLYRLTFAPGVISPVVPAPDISLVYGDAGALTAALDAPVTRPVPPAPRERKARIGQAGAGRAGGSEPADAVRDAKRVD